MHEITRMIEQFKHLVGHDINISDESLNRIAACFVPEKVKRNTLLLTQSDVCKKFYYLHTGCIRTFYITKEGQEKTRKILFENSVFTALLSFITQQPHLEFMDVLEDSQLLSMSHKDFFDLIDEIPEWELFYRKLLEHTFVFQNKKIEDLVTLSAKERYDKLMRENPHYIQRLSNRVISTYLNISQETLSRLKSK